MKALTKTLSKSDYKLGRNCLKKLWYKKNQYPSSEDGNEYLELLADGGYMVGKMATLLFPNGIEIEGSQDEALKKTQELLKQNKVTLFEAAVQSGKKIIRIDILVKEGDAIKLIEVKSKSFRLSEAVSEGYFTKAEWREYIEDIAYQKWVLSEVYPKMEVACELLMPDKDKTTEIEGLISWFSIQEKVKQGQFVKREIVFNGDLKQLKKGHVLSFINVDEVVEDYLPMVKQEAEVMLKALNSDDEKKFHVPISIACKGCEYNTGATQPNGFEACWGALAKPSPHILELGQLGNVNKRKEYKDGINRLIKQGKTALSDVPESYVKHSDPNKKYYNNRPLYQLTKRQEFLEEEIRTHIENLEYPLYFIDFETSQMAIPYHAGMRPYGKVLFQWSCHIIEQPGDEPEHFDWINVEESYPNKEFVKSLKKAIGSNGTVMTWSPYENTQLKDVLKELQVQEKLDQEEEELLAWLNVLVKRHDGDETRICDMHDWAKWYYFHPMMGGRTSIKVTLPAVLETIKSKRVKAWLKGDGLYGIGKNGKPIDPYQLLPEIEIAELAEKVKDGSGAMRAYQDMFYGLHKDDAEIKEKYKKALLQYCKLDTLAMVIIWERWVEMMK
jgi:hypothetical protein